MKDERYDLQHTNLEDFGVAGVPDLRQAELSLLVHVVQEYLDHL